jgi:hypothetical protein
LVLGDKRDVREFLSFHEIGILRGEEGKALDSMGAGARKREYGQERSTKY